MKSSVPPHVGWMDASEPVVGRWLSRRGSLRSVVRQELASRFLGGHLDGATSYRALDVGCGDGAQALRLAAAGHDVVGVDPDERMLDALAAELERAGSPVRDRVRVLRGAIDELPRLVEPASYDVVLCHGVLMYVPEPAGALGVLVDTVAPNGVVSLLVRNQANIALRAGRRGAWGEALRALQGDPAYTNNLGASARADTVPQLTAVLQRLGLAVEGWYGVRVLSDLADLDRAAPGDPDELAALLDAEELAGRTDPYRQVAPLVQVIARRPAAHT